MYHFIFGVEKLADCFAGEVCLGELQGRHGVLQPMGGEGHHHPPHCMLREASFELITLSVDVLYVEL